MLLTQAQKFGATCVVWDKDQGMQVLIMALGGRYFNIRLGEATGWNPFQMEPTKGNVAFMVRLVVFLAERRGEAVTTRQQADITQAMPQLTTDRKSVVKGKIVSVRVDSGGVSHIKKKKKNN